jgi:hypothetical protein
MTMPSLLRRILPSAALLATLLASGRAHAQMPVTDTGAIAVATSMLAKESDTLTQILQVVASLKQINASTQTAITARDPTEMAYALGILQTTENNYNDLVANTNSIGYSMKNIDSSFSTMFPQASSLQAMPSAQFDTVYTNTQAEILTASQIATRSQTDVSEIETQTKLAADILRHSADNPESMQSIAGQLQLGLQLCNVLQGDFTMLIQNLAMTGRVMSNEAAARSTNVSMSHERTRRNRLNYKYRGAPASVPANLP